jgi:hypothetical protein
LKPTPGARFISARCPRRRFRIRTTGFALSDRIGIANSARQCGSPLPRPAPLLLEPSAEQSPFHAPVALSVVVRAALVAGHLVSLVAPAFPTLQRVFFVPLPTFEHFRARAPVVPFLFVRACLPKSFNQGPAPLYVKPVQNRGAVLNNFLHFFLIAERLRVLVIKSPWQTNPAAGFVQTPPSYDLPPR